MKFLQAVGASLIEAAVIVGLIVLAVKIGSSLRKKKDANQDIRKDVLIIAACIIIVAIVTTVFILK